jgi:pyruvate/2-oxoglutarate dehydrogenase complex dihydrolipoamide dehydrogenase (E3) component
LLSEHQVRITDSFGKCEDVEAEHIILATGSRPDFPSSHNSRFFNSDDLIARVNPPARLFIIGGGYVGVRICIDGYPIFTKPDGTKTSPDLVLVATGRCPNIELLRLEEIGIAANPFILVDSQLRTNRRHIFAIGDVNGLNILDSSASAQARIAVEAIHGGGTLFSSR